MAINPYFRLRNIDENTGFGRGDPGIQFGPQIRGINISPDMDGPQMIREPLIKEPTSVLEQIARQEVGEPDDQVMMEQWMRELYKPETEATAAYQRHLDQYPTREKPGFGRKLAASLVGLGGDVGKAEKVLHAPFYRKQEDWKEQVDPRYKAAANERQENVSRLGMAREESRYRQFDRKQDLAEKKQREDQQSRDDRQRLAWYKVNMPRDAKFDVTGTTIKILDPTPGSKNPVIDTGIETGKMTQEDLQMLRNQGALDAATARGAVTTANTEARGWVVLQDEAGNRYRVNETTGEEEPIGNAPDTPSGRLTRIGTPQRTPASTNTPARERGEKNNRFRTVYDENPHLQKWLVRPKAVGGDWSMKPPPTRGYFSSEAAEKKAEQEYDEARRKLGLSPVFEKDTSSGLPTGTQTPFPDSSSTKGTVRVQAPDGRTGTWDYSKGPLPPGFKVIR